VDDVAVVRILKRSDDLFGDRERFFHWDRAGGDPIRERRPFDQRQGQATHALRLHDSEDGRDVRMIQRCQNFGFALEPAEPFRVGGKRLLAGPSGPRRARAGYRWRGRPHPFRPYRSRTGSCSARAVLLALVA